MKLAKGLWFGLAVALGLAVAQSRLQPQVAPSPWGTKHQILSPLKELLSGRSWLILEGIDPLLQRRPPWDLQTRLDWPALGGVMVTPSGAPALQAAAVGALVPFREPAPAASRNLLITRDFSFTPFQTEPHLAVNPKDPEHLVVGVIDYNFPALVTYVSYDGGETWGGPFQVPYPQVDQGSAGDPVLAFGRQGEVYIAGISLAVEESSLGPIAVVSLVSSIAVARSEDGGETWQEAVPSARSRVSTEGVSQDRFGRLRGTVVAGFLDKPWIAVGPRRDDPSQDAIYVVYTDFQQFDEIFYLGEVPALVPREVQTTIRLVRSLDGGRTWSPPVDVSPTVRRGYGNLAPPNQPPSGPEAVGAKRVVQGPQVAVAPDGTVYVAWLDTTDDDSFKGQAEIHLARSDDGGRTFVRLGPAVRFLELPFRPRTAFFRYWGSNFPHLAVGPKGEVYLVYAARPPENPRDDGDVYFLRSLDRGQTWSRPIRLGEEAKGTQFFPTLAVDPKGGIHVMWADTRQDPSGLRYHIHYTRSLDGGETWGFTAEVQGQRVESKDTRVTDFPSNPNRAFPLGLFLGDYFAIKATGEDVYMVWPDARLGEFGPPNQKIAFARLRPLPSPQIAVTPPGGPGGQPITVQGFHFQPDTPLLIQLGDAIIASARTNSEGRFTAQIYVPLTAEGPQTLRVYDASGNFAQAAFYTEFGFDNLKTLYQEILKRLEEPRR
jgi:hypothetical protein